MMRCRPESTNIDRGFASVNIGTLRSTSHQPRSILVLSGRHHISLGQYWYSQVDITSASVNIGTLRSTSHQPLSILVLSGRHHIMSNASIVNNCFITDNIISLNKKKATTLTKSSPWTMSWAVLISFYMVTK